jgi:ubiquitin carboxyl-terminal hydrolase 36/42
MDDDWHGLAGTGLYNLGNSCFMNAVLQCLAHTPPLMNYMRKRAHSPKCKHANKFCSACRLESLLHRLYQRNEGPFPPRAFADNLPLIAKGCRLGRQEDAHEFLRCLLDHLTKCFLPRPAVPLATTAAAPPTATSAATPAPASEAQKPKVTVIQNWFQGELQSQVCCLGCQAQSNTLEPFLDLSLELQGGGNVGVCSSVADALRRFTKAEYLDGDNGYRCV